MYWLNRLHEIRDEAHAAQEENLGQYAIDAIEYMVNSVKERNSAILRTYQSGGPDLHQDPHLLCLATELPDKQQGQNRLIIITTSGFSWNSLGFTIQLNDRTSTSTNKKKSR
jgi:hypothetical protein